MVANGGDPLFYDQTTKKTSTRQTYPHIYHTHVHTLG